MTHHSVDQVLDHGKVGPWQLELPANSAQEGHGRQGTARGDQAKPGRRRQLPVDAAINLDAPYWAKGQASCAFFG